MNHNVYTIWLLNLTDYSIACSRSSVGSVNEEDTVVINCKENVANDTVTRLSQRIPSAAGHRRIGPDAQRRRNQICLSKGLLARAKRQSTHCKVISSESKSGFASSEYISSNGSSHERIFYT